MRRIAVSADDNRGVDSVVSPHFGRCPYFVLVNVDGCEVSQVEAIENPFYGNHAPGAVPGFIREQGADAMVTGGMGGRAIMFFEQMGIQAVTGAYGTVRTALEAFLGGELTGAEACKTSSEHGHTEPVQVPDDGAYEKDDVGRLREEAEMLQEQLEDVDARLAKLLGE